MRLTIPILTLFLACHVSGTAHGAALNIDQVSLQGCPEIRIYLSIVDDGGNSIVGIPQSAFQVSFDGQALASRVRSFVDSGEGMAVSLVLDNSGSMVGAPLDSEKAAANAIVAALRPADRVAIVSFGNDVRVVQGFAPPSAATRQALESVQADKQPRRSKLYDGIFQAIKSTQAASGLPGRRAVIVISDGKDVESDVTLDDCIRAAGDAITPIYTVGFSQLRGKKREAFLANLRRVSRLTNGTYQVAPDAAALRDLHTSLTKRLRSLYVLRVTPANIAADGKPRELRVKAVVNGTATETVRTVRVPTGQPCVHRVVAPARVAPPPPARYRKRWVIPAAAGGSGLLVVCVLLLVLRARKRRREKEQTCSECGLPFPEGTTTCEQCTAEADEEPAVVAAPPVLAELVLIAGGPAGVKGHAFPIVGQTTVIGRDEAKCQILLPDEKVSNVHATVYLGSEGFEVHDLESSNGTFVNDQRVEQSPLAHGDELRIGAIRMKLFDKRA